MKSVVGEISKGVSGIGAVCVIAFGARRGTRRLTVTIEASTMNE